MSAFATLVVVAVAQAAFLVLLAVFLVFRHQYHARGRASFAAQSALLREPLAAWLSGARPLSALVEALRRFPAGTQVGYVSHLARTAIPPESREEFARALRGEAWARRALRGASSRVWSRRLDAARCVGLVGTPADRDTLLALLRDEVPSVAVSAVSALPRVADARMIAAFLDSYVLLPPVVQRYVNGVLRELRPIVEPAVQERLAAGGAGSRMAPFIRLARELELTQVLAALEPLAAHPEAVVRVEVARALRHMPRASTFDLLVRMLRDPDHSVRAAAARSLGEMASPAAVLPLSAAVRDPSWQVRYRAALALAQLGEPGRGVLRAMRGDADRYAADMAVLITGLSAGALLEMVDA